MSNDICGYVFPSVVHETKINLEEYMSSREVGISKITEEQLYSFPVEFIPSDDVFIFIIGDRPGYPNATYLIDYDEYDPETSDIGFPPGAKARLEILLDTLADMYRITNAEKMIVALTECNQIEIITKLKLSELYNVIHTDFEAYLSPPDTLYEITV
ncbi:hypothetical protein RI049_08690 [Cedecea neteri]|uniref:hypothetical protein n=1 Tax=Cedecea neteri TaxID=158822 RepID=UPI002AA7B6DA|nr:hypothetical protein [Cedecea neteri]WPU24799.1 hypothetical protein RI049_08690 [Cedecea neteri]